MAKCPGQDQRFWKPKDIFEISCPDCSTAIEFWKDDPQVKCPGCQKMITNPKLDISCAKWCKYAKECLGISSVNADSVLCNTLVVDMKSICQNDRQRIDHASETLKYAEMIQPQEGGNPLIVKAAAILYDVDASANPDDPNSPILARQVLVKHGVDADLIDNISQIINACRNAIEVDSVEFKIVADAHLLAIYYERFAGKSRKEIEEAIDKTFKTQQGKQLARQLLITTYT
ncbi:MAG: hypothetical protein FVQ82_12125 [Planctomycetes bacterium]|nr:hypothetical protein [Planctomycetota bacterium]